jgi:hypothetical protein
MKDDDTMEGAARKSVLFGQTFPLYYIDGEYKRRNETKGFF